MCRELDIGVIARVPFDEGSLTGKVTPETKFPPGDFRNLYFKDDRKRKVWERVERMRRDLGDAEPSLKMKQAAIKRRQAEFTR